MVSAGDSREVADNVIFLELNCDCWVIFTLG